MELFVDADACPVKEEIVRVGQRHQLKIYMVSNQRMRLPISHLIQPIIVRDGPDIADNWIVEQIQPNDIAITADIPLAARCLEKQARVVSPTGRPFDQEGIGMALAMRDLNAQLREVGIMNNNSGAFTKKERSRFLCTLEETIQAIRRSQ